MGVLYTKDLGFEEVAVAPGNPAAGNRRTYCKTDHKWYERDSAGVEKEVGIITQSTWIPDLQFGGAKVGITYDMQSGSYVKIGNLVFVTFAIMLTSKGSSSGDATIEGLPFASAGFSITNFYVSEISFANVLQSLITPTGTTINLNEVTEGGVASTLTDVDFTNTSSIMGSGWYITS
jgi:hypothetical protein